MSKSIAIIGGGRSGTSYVGKMLAVNGVYIKNHTGNTVEDLYVRSLNDKYMADHFGAIKNSGKPYGDIPDGEITAKAVDHIASERYIKTANDQIQHDYWLYKDPRTTILHDQWLTHTDVVLAVFRHPAQVIESYTKLLGGYYGDLDECRRNMAVYYRRFNRSVLYCLDHYPNVHLVEFNDNINDQVFEFLEGLGINSKVHVNNIKTSTGTKMYGCEMMYENLKFKVDENNKQTT